MLHQHACKSSKGESFVYNHFLTMLVNHPNVNDLSSVFIMTWGVLAFTVPIM